MRKQEKPIRIDHIRIGYVNHSPEYQVMMELSKKARRVVGFPYDYSVPVFKGTQNVWGYPPLAIHAKAEIEYVKNSITLIRGRQDYFLGVF